MENKTWKKRKKKNETLSPLAKANTVPIVKSVEPQNPDHNFDNETDGNFISAQQQNERKKKHMLKNVIIILNNIFFPVIHKSKLYLFFLHLLIKILVF
jgi:hypothetical protein